jgi:hypothetical protein
VGDAFTDEAAAAQRVGAIGDTQRLARHLLDQQDRGARLRQPLNGGEHLADETGRETE